MLAITQGTRESWGRRMIAIPVSVSFLFAYVFIWDAGHHGHGLAGLRETECPSPELGRPEVKVCWVPAKGLSLYKKNKFRKVDTPACQERHNPMLLVNAK